MLTLIGVWGLLVVNFPLMKSYRCVCQQSDNRTSDFMHIGEELGISSHINSTQCTEEDMVENEDRIIVEGFLNLGDKNTTLWNADLPVMAISQNMSEEIPVCEISIRSNNFQCYSTLQSDCYCMRKDQDVFYFVINLIAVKKFSNMLLRVQFLRFDQSDYFECCIDIPNIFGPPLASLAVDDRYINLASQCFLGLVTNERVTLTFCTKNLKVPELSFSHRSSTVSKRGSDCMTQDYIPVDFRDTVTFSVSDECQRAKNYTCKLGGHRYSVSTGYQKDPEILDTLLFCCLLIVVSGCWKHGLTT